MQIVVTTSAGRVEGRVTDGVAAFLGIPYAAPPFGANRFGAPRRPAPWDGLREASSYGATCPKLGYGPPYDALLPEPAVPGEDCLNLNVWTPDPGAAGLPVMVWVHGGSFTNGSGAVPVYAGDRFARDGVVCVTLNYRLGCDGFLLLDDAPANRGLLDQLAALEWVQENIAGFGGDPANVTVFGESAGAMSVTTLLCLEAGVGLFRRAIAQSGGGHHVHEADTARLVTAELTRQLGVAPTREALAAVGVDRLLEGQRQLIVEVASAADGRDWRELATNLMPFEPVIDGELLTTRPIDAVAGGAGRDVELLVGTTRDEYRFFLIPSGAADAIDESLLAQVSSAYGLAADRLRAYRCDGDDPADVCMEVCTDWWFRIPAIRLAEAHRGTTHAYEFAWPSSLHDGRLRACHALELAFVFDTLDADGATWLTGPDPPAALASTMHSAWVAFATSGDPGWPAYDPSTRATMTFDVENRVLGDPRAEQREAWLGVR